MSFKAGEMFVAQERLDAAAHGQLLKPYDTRHAKMSLNYHSVRALVANVFSSGLCRRGTSSGALQF